MTQQLQDFKIILPQEVDAKIRIWCLMCPNLEWSGTLFYTNEGTFDDNNLTIHVKDFSVHDIGSATFTSFEEDAEMLSYMMEHDLLDCVTGLIHSHNTMKTFFSGTDVSTLQKEGAIRNHFVSLIVNNKGEYTAKITRQVTFEVKASSYKTFNDVDIPINGELETITKVFDYPLKVIREGNWDYEANLFKELSASKAVSTAKVIPSTFPVKTTTNLYSKPAKVVEEPTLFDNGDDYNDWYNNWYDDYSNYSSNAENSIRTIDPIIEASIEDLITDGGEAKKTYVGKFDIFDYCTNYMETYFDSTFETTTKLRDYLDEWFAAFIDGYETNKEAEDAVKELRDFVEDLPSNKYMTIIKYEIDANYYGYN